MPRIYKLTSITYYSAYCTPNLQALAIEACLFTYNSTTIVHAYLECFRSHHGTPTTHTQTHPKKTMHANHNKSQCTKLPARVVLLLLLHSSTKSGQSSFSLVWRCRFPVSCGCRSPSLVLLQTVSSPRSPVDPAWPSLQASRFLACA